VQLPISRTALDRLGKRLIDPGGISAADAELFGQILQAYDQTLADVCERLEKLGYIVTDRLKTKDTLLDKLRREHGMRLKDVQDVAGARITVPGTRADQDNAVASILAAFDTGTRPPQVRDRRDKPSSGYRAVHVVVFPGNIPVEIQVRTELQHVWAQVFEVMGDVWGRAIRYGGQPAEPDAPAIPSEPGPGRASVVAAMLSIGDVVDRFEVAERSQPVGGSAVLATEKAGLFLLLRSTLHLFEQADGVRAEV
jgi:hypothetical protein